MLASVARSCAVPLKPGNTTKCSRPRRTVVEGIVGVVAHLRAIEAVITVYPLSLLWDMEIVCQEAVDLTHKVLQIDKLLVYQDKFLLKVQDLCLKSNRLGTQRGLVHRSSRSSSSTGHSKAVH